MDKYSNSRKHDLGLAFYKEVEDQITVCRLGNGNICFSIIKNGEHYTFEITQDQATHLSKVLKDTLESKDPMENPYGS